MSRNLLTTNEAADLLGIARTSLINWLKKGELESSQTPGGHRRFKLEEILMFAEKRGFELNTDLLSQFSTGIKEVKKSQTSSYSLSKVLVVDDDSDFRQFAQDCLSIAGSFDVKEATNGIEAALTIGSWKPDLVLLDLRMPGMNGIEFCKEMKSKPEFESVKVVIMSAYSEKESLEEVEGLGIDSVLQKPIGIKDFVDKIKEILK